MARSDGFAVMDVSTSICDEPKFRLLQRRNPELVAAAFTAYIATVAESWRSGRRVTIDHAWPAFLPFDEAVQPSLTDVGLLDRAGMVPAKSWRSWFDPANERRASSRVRWARYNAKRNADTASLPRGDDAATATSVRSSRTAPSVPSEPTDRADDSPVERMNGRGVKPWERHLAPVKPTGTER